MGLASYVSGIKIQSKDVIDWAMRVQIALLPLILVWGIAMETLHAFKFFPGDFDMPSFFNATLNYELGVCALLGTGSAHTYFQKTTDADGTTTETASLTTTKTKTGPAE
jgi:hypothetical protein